MSEYTNIQVKVVGPVTLVKPAGDELVQRDDIDLVNSELLEYIQAKQPQKVVMTLKASISIFFRGNRRTHSTRAADSKVWWRNQTRRIRQYSRSLPSDAS